MRNKRLRVAIAGAGMVTRHHLIAWSRLPQIEIVAIFNRTLEKAYTRAKEFGIPKVYSNLEEMLRNEKPDVLDIAVAPEAHRQFAKIASEYGVNILCQKPMALTLKEAEEMIAEIGDKVRFMVHENWRFRPPYRQAAKWIAEGITGTIHEFQLSTRSSGLITKTENGKPFAIARQPYFANMSRFIILELLIHHLDTARFLMGELDVISAQTLHISKDIIGEDVAQIGLKAKNGAIGTISGNLSAPGFPPLPRDYLELIGDRSSIIFDGETLSLTGEKCESIHFIPEEIYQKSYDNLISHFVYALQNGSPFETNPLDNLKTIRLVEKAYQLASCQASMRE
ncbi:MAG: Gfo/Idh/MocA family oxidoreductase [Candidatus Anstonellales archaeon]